MVLKKKFFTVELPLIKQSVELLSFNEESLAGRTVKVDLTRKLRGKSIEAVFALSNENGKIKADPRRMHILGFFMRRMMRKSIDYVEDSFSVDCLNAVLKIKPFLITRKKVHASVRTALRNKCKEEIIDALKNLSYDDIFYDVISNKIQRHLSSRLKKVYPLALCEIRDIYVEKIKENVKIEKVKEAANEIIEEIKEKDMKESNAKEVEGIVKESKVEEALEEVAAEDEKKEKKTRKKKEA